MLPDNRFPDTAADITASPLGDRQRHTDRTAPVDETVGTSGHIVHGLIAGRIPEKNHRDHRGRQAAEKHGLMNFVCDGIHDRILS